MEDHLALHTTKGLTPPGKVIEQDSSSQSSNSIGVGILVNERPESCRVKDFGLSLTIQEPDTSVNIFQSHPMPIFDVRDCTHNSVLFQSIQIETQLIPKLEFVVESAAESHAQCSGRIPTIAALVVSLNLGI